MATHHLTRIDTLDLKDHIYRKIGRQRAEEYFHQLNRFLNSKLSKADFSKSCILIIGRENIPLHNQLLQSILHNACRAKTPPQKARIPESKAPNGYQRNCLQSLYGDAFPRKCRSPRDHRKARDRPSPLGPLGKSPSITCEETVSRIQEQQMSVHSLSSRPPMEDGEEVEQLLTPSALRWHSVNAPLSRSSGRAHKSLRLDEECCWGRGKLPDTGSLRSRMQRQLALEGVEVSKEGAEVLNSGLNVFMKRLIERCVGISGKYAGAPAQQASASMLDFRVVMELDPHVLGEEWSVQLEKICMS